MTQCRVLTPGKYKFQDVEVGDRIETESVVMSEGLINRFAELSGDHYAIHMDQAVANSKGFPDRVAHGLLVLSLVDGLKNNSKASLDGLASLGWTWRFERPVFIGDVIRAELSIVGKRQTQSGKRGILIIDIVVKNDKNLCVQCGKNELMFDL